MSDDLTSDFGLDPGGDDSADDSAQAMESVFDSNQSYDTSTDLRASLFEDQGDIDDSSDESADVVPSPDQQMSAGAGDDAVQPGGPVTMNYEGTEYLAGEATLDADGDGVADTAVQDHGYQVEYYVDSDGDGQADELTITDPDGNLISHTENVEGTASWVSTPGPDTASGDVTTSDDNAAPAETEPGEDDVFGAGGEQAAAGQATISGDVTDLFGGTGDEAADAGADDSGAGGDLTVTIDGQDYEVGEPTLDITGDGVADTVVVENDGNVEYYVDTDNDGVADQIIVLSEEDGALVNHEVYDPATGTWTNVTEESTNAS